MIPLAPLLLISLILLPSMEVYLFLSWIGESPVVALLYLAATMFLGVVCIRLAKLGLGEALVRARHLGAGDAGILLTFGKLWIVGILFFFPGYITDIIALWVWLFTGRGKRQDDKATVVEAQLLDEE